MGIILFNPLNLVVLTIALNLIGFRPLMGIILFNLRNSDISKTAVFFNSFRPLMGIILFNPVFETTGIY